MRCCRATAGAAVVCRDYKGGPPAPRLEPWPAPGELAPRGLPARASCEFMASGVRVTGESG